MAVELIAAVQVVACSGRKAAEIFVKKPEVKKRNLVHRYNEDFYFIDNVYRKDIFTSYGHKITWLISDSI